MVNKVSAMHEMIDRMNEKEIEKAYDILKRFRRKGSSRKWMQPMPATPPSSGGLSGAQQRLH